LLNLEQEHQAADEAQSEGASGEGADQAGGWIEQVSIKNGKGKTSKLFGVEGDGKGPVPVEVLAVIPD